MKYALLLFSLVFTLSSHSATFEKIREYRYSIFETDKQCREYQEKVGGWFNCFQYVKFMPNGSATVLLTDIMNRATYTLDLDTESLILLMEGPGDMPSKMNFRLSPNWRAMVELNNFKVWELKTAE